MLLQACKARNGIRLTVVLVVLVLTAPAASAAGSPGSPASGAEISARTVLAAPPANDSFGAAAAISALPSTVNATNVQATLEGGESPNLSNCTDRSSTTIGSTVWYTLTVSQGGSTVQIDTAGSNFDTVLAVHTGSSIGSL